MNPVAREWFLFELTVGGAVGRQRVNLEAHIFSEAEWDAVNGLIALSAISAGCAILERHGHKSRDQHTRLLFEIRNSLIHNSGDLNLNRNSNSVQMAQTYFQNSTWLELSPEIASYYELHGSKVSLKGSVFHYLRVLLI